MREAIEHLEEHNKVEPPMTMLSKSEDLWKEIGCFPDVCKHYIWFWRSRIFEFAGKSEEAIYWLEKDLTVAPEVSK
jgi:hypothetical protein